MSYRGNNKIRPYKILNCDIDGVIANCIALTMVRVYRQYGILRTEDALVDHDIAECIANEVPKDRLLKEDLHKFLWGVWTDHEFLLGLQPYLTMWYALLTYEKRYDPESVRYITARNGAEPGIKSATRAWLSRLGLRGEVIYTKDKVPMIEEGDLLIEDKSETALALHKVNPAAAILVARPWNCCAGPVPRYTEVGIRKLILSE